jgi:hypothetical protein
VLAVQVAVAMVVLMVQELVAMEQQIQVQVAVVVMVAHLLLSLVQVVQALLFFAI